MRSANNTGWYLLSQNGWCAWRFVALWMRIEGWETEKVKYREGYHTTQNYLKRAAGCNIILIVW